MNEFLQGFLLQASLILALGAQNLFVLEMGLKRRYHLLIATICSICDIILILIGTLGVSSLISSVAELKIIVGFIGVAFLLYYAIVKIREFLYFSTKIQRQHSAIYSKRKVVIMSLSFTLLNPHVYIDTIFLIGGYSTKFDTNMNKFIFGVGAGVFSALWFYSLSICSSKFSIFLRKDRVSMSVSLISGLLLAYLAYELGIDSYGEYDDYIK
jgi:L-lysine exporter family protein LysE/ArgO